MSTGRNPATQHKRTSRSRLAMAAEAAPAKGAAQRQPRKGSAMAAAMAVLDGKLEPMTAKEIYAEIRKRKLAPDLRCKTPDQTIAAQLAVNAKRVRYV